MSGVGIVLDRANIGDSKKAAQDMVTGYSIVAKSALNTRQTYGLAIAPHWSGDGH
jgi:hypothetical protein